MGIKELLRLVTYGLTEGELREHLGTLLKDAHTEAEQDETQASEDRVDEILSDINLGTNITCLALLILQVGPLLIENNRFPTKPSKNKFPGASHGSS